MASYSVPGEDSKWFGVRLIFRMLNDGQPTSTYEERITLWRADSGEEAIAMAEREADDYTSTLDEHPYIEYLGLAQVFHTFIPDRPIEPGDEVFSLLRDSPRKPRKYMKKFFSTGTEHQVAIDDDRLGQASTV